MVIAATSTTDLNVGIFRDAEARHMLVNVVDVPPLCNFILPAIVRTGPIAIAISTSGASPALAKRLKREIAEQFGAPHARLAEILNELRGWAKDTFPTYEHAARLLREHRERAAGSDRAAPGRRRGRRPRPHRAAPGARQSRLISLLTRASRFA